MPTKGRKSSRISTFQSLVERNAVKAEDLEAFRGFKLAAAKDVVDQALHLIGRDGIFSQYTDHSIKHIDAILELASWLVPVKTAALMSPADWLMLCLALYFHDLGMLVTRNEFDRRTESDFPDFCKTLLSGETATDYNAKLSRLPDQEKERFLYEEYVRKTHAQRIRHWVSGKVPYGQPATDAVVRVLNKVLQDLPQHFREDLGFICESHHLADLDDFSKYNTRRSYGRTDDETANLQYVALILRTADLLHMTKDRVPSITFQLIAPTDPFSIGEWEKQHAVYAVRQMLPRDVEGAVDPTQPADTIEIFARCASESAYFGISKYIHYCKDQIALASKWARLAMRKENVRHEFPWKAIDDSGVETVGFEKTEIGFRIDEQSILELLTGSLLYRNRIVAVREMVQNSIDACRLNQLQLGPRGSDYRPEVVVTWNSKARILCVIDNGTGMSRSDVEQYFLTVGKSRYREPEFKRRFPDFAPISRFGIGILSTFMIANRVALYTKDVSSPSILHLSFASVHGKYLLRHLSQSPEFDDRRLGASGTVLRLEVRHDVDLGTIGDVLAYWFAIPSCDCVLEVDGVRKTFGHLNCSELISSYLESAGYELVKSPSAKRKNSEGKIATVIQHKAEGAELVVGLAWDPFDKAWQLIRLPDPDRNDRRSVWLRGSGVLIEGVRVTSETPGFLAPVVYAFANFTGSSAPSPDVGRERVEFGEASGGVLTWLAQCWADILENICTKWAVKDDCSPDSIARHCLFALTEIGGQSPLKSIARKETSHALTHECPLYLVDNGTTREAISLSAIQKAGQLWTHHGPLYTAAQGFVAHQRGRRSVKALLKAVELQSVWLAKGMVLGSVRKTEHDPTVHILEFSSLDDVHILPDYSTVVCRWRTVKRDSDNMRVFLKAEDGRYRSSSSGFALIDAPVVVQSKAAREFSIIQALEDVVFVLQKSEIGRSISDYLAGFSVGTEPAQIAEGLVRIALHTLVSNRGSINRYDFEYELRENVRYRSGLSMVDDFLAKTGMAKNIRELSATTYVPQVRSAW